MRNKLKSNPLQQAILKCLAISSVAVFSIGAQADVCDVIYGVQDDGLNHSQLVTIDKGTYNVTRLGDIHPGHDIEGLDITSNGSRLMGTSGDEGYQPGSLYEFNPADGTLVQHQPPLGQICFDVQVDLNDDGILDIDEPNVCGTEISSISFHPKTNDLWAWSEECGLLKVDTDEPANSKLIYPYSSDSFAACLGDEQAKKSYTSHVEDISWDNSGLILYFSDGSKGQIFAYDGQNVTPIGSQKKD